MLGDWFSFWTDKSDKKDIEQTQEKKIDIHDNYRDVVCEFDKCTKSKIKPSEYSRPLESSLPFKIVKKCLVKREEISNKENFIVEISNMHEYKASIAKEMSIPIKEKCIANKMNFLTKKEPIIKRLPLSTEYKLYPFYNRREIVDTVKDFMNRVENVKGTENKKMITVELFDYLVENKFFVDYHQGFSNTLRQKLEEFAIVEDFWLCSHYNKLFSKDLIDVIFKKEHGQCELTTDLPWTIIEKYMDGKISNKKLSKPQVENEIDKYSKTIESYVKKILLNKIMSKMENY